MKKYEITYAPNIKLAQEVANVHDAWDCDNAVAPYIYVQINNHNRGFTEKVTVEAPNKQAARAMLAVELFRYGQFQRVKGGIEPLIYDAIKNVVSITEVAGE